MSGTVLITGTSSGLGLATAKVFHARGWNVIATMRAPEDGKELASLERTLVARLDVQDPSSIAGAVRQGIDEFGKIDVLVNNAGYGAYGPLEATPAEEIRRQFDVNVFGPLSTIKALLPHFRANRSGVIVNISSIGGLVAFPLGSLYHGSKFAIEGLSEALAYELTPIGVRVKLVEPGMIATDFGGRSLAFSNDRSLAEYQPTVQAVMQAFAAAIIQASKPEAIAEVVYVAATDDGPKVRFVAGEDAQRLSEGRRTTDEAAFMGQIRTAFGLTSDLT
ncbi:SDR family oxidoreductase [Bradyrhizobium sp. BR 10289]|uniref:SDR family oxidoreductase n=1 Tax=Bradyrhizobium sp. BR 10289 TaxID=2749993 RepID=UPI001C645F60|nr:SDR family oxidoreductase [Bradyrhizobium sp. BR 10289]MBW7970193.1 SDR family oxidoreductase [Bradyrhizobium sp. BR 10289]